MFKYNLKIIAAVLVIFVILGFFFVLSNPLVMAIRP